MILQYGYLALFIGSLAEGETVLLIAGVIVHQGLLNYGWTVVIAILGGTLGDQILFAVGRYYGSRLLKRFHSHQHKITKANALIHRYPSLFVIGVRFMYGLRLLGPIIIGASHLNPIKFFWLNIVGAIFWALIFVTLGYLGGRVISPWLHQLDQYFKYLFFFVITIAILWGVRLTFRHWKNRREKGNTSNE